MAKHNREIALLAGEDKVLFNEPLYLMGSPMIFSIPKQTDRSLVNALAQIKEEMKGLCPLRLEVMPFAAGGSQIQLPDGDTEKAESIQFVLSEESEIMPWLRLRDRNGHTALHLERRFDNIIDTAKVAEDNNFINGIPEQDRGRIIVRLLSLARKVLRSADAEAALSGGTGSDWSRYRDAQQAILSSLQETLKTIATDYSRKLVDAEESSRKQLEQNEERLKSRYNAMEQKLSDEHSERNKLLDSKEATIKTREESFDTKEARYVARQEQQNQIKQIQGWLEGWSLTKGTRAKRYPVAVACWFGIAASGALAVYLSYQTAEIFKEAASDLTKISWWQWLVISLRSILPLATFVALVIYLIRWSASWARQHAEEEFRNRARILDIGRTAWLIEAVRDAQDNQKELPPELIQELSRNLFAYPASMDAADLQPHNVTDLILQGLSSLRLRAPDGTELEAKRRRVF